jgi:hypothetical protein
MRDFLRVGRDEFAIAYVKCLVHDGRALDGIMAEHFDILIVVRGSAGSTAGTSLAKQGWSVAILMIWSDRSFHHPV